MITTPTKDLTNLHHVFTTPTLVASMPATRMMPQTPHVHDEVELSSSFEQSGDERELFSLPQADGGKDAWLFLASTFIFEAITWGERVECLSI